MKLTPLQAYTVMQHFLECYFQKTRDGDLGLLLTSMDLLVDGISSDSWISEDWTEITKPYPKMTETETLKSILALINSYYPPPYPSEAVNVAAQDIVLLRAGKAAPEIKATWDTVVNGAIMGELKPKYMILYKD